MSSRIPGFYRFEPERRLTLLSEQSSIADDDLQTYRDGGLTTPAADAMIENVISTLAIPNAVACNFIINGRDRLIPMAVEEPSVVAAASNMAKLVRETGGFQVDVDPSVMIGQIQIPCGDDAEHVATRLSSSVDALMDQARRVHPTLIERGGGPRGFEVRILEYDEPGHEAETMVVLHVLLDCADAMGANMVNTLCERLAPTVEQITGKTVALRILSNLSDRRLARATCKVPFEALEDASQSGIQVAQAIASAWRFAWADPYRAATHNKGIMNGIDAVALATGNDWRAIEAGAHAYAAHSGQYRPLSRWEICDGALYGRIEIPLQVGVVGGPIRVHPTVQANLRLLECDSARDLAGVMAAVGLAQNLGALRALASEGIQAGHMRMHARTIAATAGATGQEVAQIAARLVAEQDFRVDRAQRLLATMRSA